VPAEPWRGAARHRHVRPAGRDRGLGSARYHSLRQAKEPVLGVVQRGSVPSTAPSRGSCPRQIGRDRCPSRRAARRSRKGVSTLTAAVAVPDLRATDVLAQPIRLQHSIGFAAATNARSLEQRRSNSSSVRAHSPFFSGQSTSPSPHCQRTDRSCRRDSAGSGAIKTSAVPMPVRARAASSCMRFGLVPAIPPIGKTCLVIASDRAEQPP
jgi:hypothetical protein